MNTQTVGDLALAMKTFTLLKVDIQVRRCWTKGTKKTGETAQTVYCRWPPGTVDTCWSLVLTLSSVSGRSAWSRSAWSHVRTWNTPAPPAVWSCMFTNAFRRRGEGVTSTATMRTLFMQDSTQADMHSDILYSLWWGQHKLIENLIVYMLLIIYWVIWPFE